MIPNFKDHAANERTFLAWLRTAIAMVGVALTAAKLTGSNVPQWTNLAMIGAGGVVVALAFIRMHLLRRRIDAEEEPDGLSRNWPDVVLVALAIAMIVLTGIFVLHVL
ncbi:YidH family protein [Thioclava sp.]|uniref:YidH family protein n=1 Tax=Thioclava sp. TaxID=1933450 RepID=UPI003AA9C2F6